MIKVGALAGIATTFLEKDVGFWSAYLLGFCTLWPSLFILIAWRKQFSKDTYVIRTLIRLNLPLRQKPATR